MSEPNQANPQRKNPRKNRPQQNQKQGQNSRQNQGQKAAAPQKKGGAAGCAIVVVILLLTIGLPVFFAGLDEGWFSSSDDTDVTVVAPTRQEADDLAAQLAAAEKAHGICYGWTLEDSDAGTDVPLSQGSSRGAGTDPRTCDRWVALEVDIDYSAPSSDFEDSAYLRVTTSDDLDADAPSTTDLDRMGVNEAAAINDPAATVGMGALALPLLMVEQGAADALPPAEAASPPATAISRPGSDFVGNNSGTLVALGIFGGIAVLCLIIGFVVRARAGKAR